MQARLMFIHALSPVHTGTGQSVDVIDLPVARETTTNWPYIPGSSIRGVLRDVCDDKSDTFKCCFGTEDAKTAGQLLVCDGHLLCLPVRSFYGTFAWVTCPSAVLRLARDSMNGGIGSAFELPASASDLGFDQAVVAADNAVASDDKVYLEDLDLTVTSKDGHDLAGAIAGQVFPGDPTWHGEFTKRFAIVSDDMFGFLSETATEVVARIRIDDESKVADDGALWYEEAIPTEAIFASMMLAEPRNGKTADDLFGFVKGKPIKFVQIGGNAGVGRGFVRVVLQ